MPQVDPELFDRGQFQAELALKASPIGAFKKAIRQAREVLDARFRKRPRHSSPDRRSRLVRRPDPAVRPGSSSTGVTRRANRAGRGRWLWPRRAAPLLRY